MPTDEPPSMPLDEYRAANRNRWDEAVAVHAASEFYGVDRFLAGESTLLDLDRESVGPVEGKTLLHLQCHFGMDTLSWAREGASVVGVDFSSAAVAKARELAEQAGLTERARFVEAELYDSPNALNEQFDIVYVNIGALIWLPDIPGWARVVAQFLRPGGLFYIHEIHPLTQTLDFETSDPLTVRYPYFDRPQPQHYAGTEDYASQGSTFEHTDTYEWSHSLGEIVTSLIQAGLTIESLHEHDWTTYQPLPGMTETSRGIWRLPDNLIPLTYTLRARKNLL